MRIEVVEARTPQFEPWVSRWYFPWAAAFEAGVSAGLADPVLLSRGERLARLRAPVATERRLLLAAVDRNEVLGAAHAELPMRDNVALCSAVLAVPPAHRRHGYGTALLEAVQDVAEQAGRASLLTEIDRPVDVAESWPGSEFAQRHGFTLRLSSVRRDLPLPVDPGRVERLRAEASGHARGYRLECFPGPTRPADRGRMAAMKARMTTDAPMGDLDYEPEMWDAGRVADQEVEARAMGFRWWTAVAVDGDGSWAGFTQLGWSPDEPGRLHQWDTLVLREHRGRRLGMLMKLAALETATGEVPQARRVSTWNAASNGPMIAVNEAMGFVPSEISEEWQADLSQLA